jgi:hypothetical protein
MLYVRGMRRQRSLIIVLANTVLVAYLSIASFFDLFNVVLPFGRLDFSYIEAGIMINLAILIFIISRTRNDSNKTMKRS